MPSRFLMEVETDLLVNIARAGDMASLNEAEFPVYRRVLEELRRRADKNPADNDAWLYLQARDDGVIAL